VNASSEREDEAKSALVSRHNSNKQVEEVLRKYDKSKRHLCSAKLLRTLARGVKAVKLKACFTEPEEFSLKTLQGEATSLRSGVKRQPESRMREIRTSGSEGGVRLDPSFLPLLPFFDSFPLKIAKIQIIVSSI